MLIPGVDPSAIRQLLLQHTYLPLISVLLSHNADALFQHACKNPLILALQVFRPYGNNAKHGTPGQTYSVTNTLLISRTYTLFPVRFEPLLPELLTVHNPSDSKLTGLFSISSLEMLMRQLLDQNDVSDPRDADSNLYAGMFRRIVTSNKVVLFDTFNHPVSQIFVVDGEHDTLDDLRRMVVEFRNYAYPKYFQMGDVLVHVFVVYTDTSEAAVARFQNDIRIHLTLSSTAIPVGNGGECVRMFQFDNATIDNEVQHISLQRGRRDNNEDPSADANTKDTKVDTNTDTDVNSLNSIADTDTDDYVDVPIELDTVIRSRVHDFIAKNLIPHMERRMRMWDDGILAPKKSIAGRFFSVSRKLFNSEQVATGETYNVVHNYYYRASPEQALRKLADWAVMLKDFKYAYSTYDLIKKDYTNDKAWVYVAAAQEMCMAALLLAQTQPIASDTLPQPPDKNTLRKIRHDIIEPYVDNLLYTFKLRFNVRTYAVRAYLVVAELLLNMSVMFHIPGWWSDLVESYYGKCIAEINAHLAGQDGPQALRAVLYERMGYAMGRFVYVPDAYRTLVSTAYPVTRIAKDPEQPDTEKTDETDAEKIKGTDRSEQADSTTSHYRNHNKLPVDSDNAIKGLTRFRKRLLWYLLSMAEWLRLENVEQTRVLARFVEVGFDSGWSERDGFVWRRVKEAIAAG